jgi:hypothetical protein
MRFLRDLLTLSGAACIGLALGGYVAANLPLYRVNNIATIPRCDLLLSTGVALLIIAYGFRRPAVFAWWAGCFAYMILLGYFIWRTVSRLELFSYFTVIALIAELPFAALLGRYAKLYFIDDKDS